MKRLAIATLVVALSFGIAVAQDKPAADKPAAPKTTEKAKDAGCGESTGCCGEMKSSKDKKAVKAQKPATKTADKTAKPAKAN
jgi:hypothetical protein